MEESGAQKWSVARVVTGEDDSSTMEFIPLDEAFPDDAAAQAEFVREVERKAAARRARTRQGLSNMDLLSRAMGDVNPWMNH